MRCGALAVVVATSLAGCAEHGHSPAVDAPIDQAPAVDAPHPRNDPGMGPFVQPFDATFITPAGSFDGHFLFAQAIWGDCDPPVWELRFSAVQSGAEPSVTLHVTLPHYTGMEVTGTLAASATFHSDQPQVTHTTQAVTFDAMRIDYPADGAPRITGRFRDTDPGWTIDLPIDILGASSGCI